MRPRYIAVLALLFVIFIAIPTVAEAQTFPGDTGVRGIVPCGDLPGFYDCGSCDLVALGQDVINFAVYFSVFVATLLFVWAGFLYVTAGGDESQVKKAHGMFFKVAVGLIIILTAWLVVDIIMSTFLTKEKPYGPWNQIICSSSSARSEQQVRREQGDVTDRSGLIVGTPDDTIVGLSHDENLSRLTREGIEVTSTSGPDGVQANCTGRGCTSLEGMRQTTVDEAIFLKRECDCRVVVTGGTEGGGVHEEGEFAHTTGYKIDVDDTPAATAYIEENYFKFGERNNGDPIYISPRGAQYVREGNHWDILVTGRE